MKKDFKLKHCPTCNQMTNHLGDICQKCEQESDWEKEFDRGFASTGKNNLLRAGLRLNDIKDFIKTLLSQQEAKTLAEMREKLPEMAAEADNIGGTRDTSEGLVIGWNSYRDKLLENLDKLTGYEKETTNNKQS